MIDPGLIVTAVVVMVVATVAIFPGFCGYVANTKGRSIKAWVLLGIFFGPVALLAIVGATPRWDEMASKPLPEAG